MKHFLISFWQLRLILPVARVSDARPSYLGFRLLESGATFLFVPIVRLTDVLGWFTLPVIFSEKQLSSLIMLRELAITKSTLVIQIVAYV